MKCLVIAEHDQKNLAANTLRTISAAKRLAIPMDILVAGHHCETVAEQAASLEAVDTVWIANHAVYQPVLAENFSALVAKMAAQYTHVLAPASTFGKDILPRVAALCDVAVIADVTRIIDHETFIRPLFAGNIMATVRSVDAIKMLTIRATAFSTAQKSIEGGNKAHITMIDSVIENQQSRFETRCTTKSDRPELGEAKTVVSGGRGFKNKENFEKQLGELADKLGAAIGASRAAVDAGFAPNDYQVGQTGRVVAPELYIAIGISGAIQHIAGMKDSKIIVAINSDPDAPIFEIADYGLVADLFVALPELVTLLGTMHK